MFRTRAHLLWIIPLLGLILLSLFRQSHHPETLGQRMIALLQKKPYAAHLRGALPLRQMPSPPPDPTPISLRPISSSSTDGDTWEGPAFTLHRPQELSLIRAAVKSSATQQSLEQLFSSLGYVNQKPHDIVAAAAADLLALSDDTLLSALFQADAALLQQADDPEQVAMLTLLLIAWDPTSAAAVLELPSGGRLYAVETLSSSSADSWHLTLLRMNSDGAELWHATLLLPRQNNSASALAIIAQALPQLEIPAPAPDSLPQLLK